MLTCPAARLMIEAGIKNGEILRGPPSSRALCSRSITSKPPTPEPICTPTRSSFSGVIFSSDIFIASAAAAMARWMKRAIFFTSFFSMKFKGSNPLTSARIRQPNPPASNCVILPTPLRPATILLQTSVLVPPTPQIRPKPVTTTLLDKLLAAFRVLIDVLDRVFDGTDLFGVFVGDLDVEGFFEGHDQLDGVERIGAKIVYEGGVRRDFALVNSELFNNDLLNFLFHCCHTIASPSCVEMLLVAPIASRIWRSSECTLPRPAR